MPLTRPQPPTTGFVERLGGRLEMAKFLFTVATKGVTVSFTGNFNGFILSTTFLGLLVESKKTTFIHLNQLDTESWAPLVNEYQAFLCFFYTPQLHLFVSSESFKTTDLSCVKLVTAVGSALSPAAREHVMKEFEVHQKKMSPNMPIVGMAYGTTEIGYPMFRMSFSTNNEVCSKSVGTYPRTRDFDVQVRHLEEERLCQNGEPGNIFLLCPLRIRNYWHTRDQLPFQWVQK